MQIVNLSRVKKPSRSARALMSPNKGKTALHGC